MAALDLQGKVGPQVVSDGSDATMRLGRSAEVIIQQVRGRYYEAVKRGNVFAAAVPGAGVTPGTAIGTTATLSLHNPVTSRVDLVIMRATLGYISGTLGAGSVYYVGHITPSQAAPSGGTAITPVNAYVAGGGSARAAAGSGTTVPTGGSLLGVMCSLTAILASTAVGVYSVVDELDGAIIIAPGGILSLQPVAAGGSTPLVSASLEWEEVPI